MQIAYSNIVAGDLMLNLPIYITEETSISKVIEKVKELGLSKITVTDSKFKAVATISKREIAKFILKNKIRQDDPRIEKIKIKELINPEQNTIVAYPNTNIEEIYEIMDVLGIDYMPIVKNPWEKVLIGFVPFNKIQAMLENSKIAK